MIDTEFSTKNLTLNFFEETGTMNGRTITPLRNPKLVHKNMNQSTTNIHSSKVQTYMSGCSRIDLDFYYKDKDGNTYGLRGRIDLEGKDTTEQNTTDQNSTDQGTTADPDNKPDSWDHDYE